MDDKLTDKVSTAPEDVEAFCNRLAGSCGNHPICHEAAVTLRELSAEVERLKVALRDAEQFIVNGTELGFIKMPTLEIDPAHKTLPMIRAALGE